MRKLFAAILLVSALFLFSCGQKNTRQNAETQKTAVLFSSLAEVWTEAGGRVDITVGEAVERGFAPKGTPIVDEGAGKTVNLELLLSYKPTLVICSSDIPAQSDAAALLEESGVKVLSLHIESFSDYIFALDKMTDITGNKTAYDNAVRTVGARIESVLESAEIKALHGTRILFVRAGSTPSSTKSKSSSEHFAASMLSEMGCINIADGAASSELSIEAILEYDPEYIFFSLMGDEEAARANVNSLLCSDTWSSLTAVKEGRAVILPKELFHFKPCARWGEAYEFLADILTDKKQ